MDVTLPVAVRPLRTCFVNLPRSFIHRLGQTLTHVVLRLDWTSPRTATQSSGGSTAYVAWGGTISAHEQLEISAALAEALELKSPVVVRVRTADVPMAVSLSLEPETHADWLVIQDEAQQLEDQILTQVLVASKGQRLPLWVNGTQSIWLRVTGCSPAAPAVRLGSGTELQASYPSEPAPLLHCVQIAGPLPRALRPSRSHVVVT